MKKTTGFTPMGDRYVYDFKLCTPAKGWAQLDTKQDASYYGNWVNPTKLELVSYCEGDATHIACESEEEFKTELKSVLEWQQEHGHEPKIDGMCNPEIIAAFERLGFKDNLH